MIGNGTGDWDVPVGGMGALTDALAARPRAAGAELRYRRRGDRRSTPTGAGALGGRGAPRPAHVLVNAAPHVLAGLLGEPDPEPAAEGAQLKVNMLLSGCPGCATPPSTRARRSRAPSTSTRRYAQLAGRLRRRPTRGRAPGAAAVRDLLPLAHRPVDPRPGAARRGRPDAHAASACTCRRGCSRDDDAVRKARAVAATLRSLDAVLAEPIEDCLWRTPTASPCIEARTPLDLERELGLPGGNIFHRDLTWPFAEADGEVGRAGASRPRTPSVLLCGAGARRGGGVSGIPGHNAAMAVLDATEARENLTLTLESSSMAVEQGTVVRPRAPARRRRRPRALQVVGAVVHQPRACCWRRSTRAR